MQQAAQRAAAQTDFLNAQASHLKTADAAAQQAAEQAADDAAYTKFAVKELARSMGMTASFLAKTASGEEGSSGHVHLSLWKGGTNAFAGEDANRCEAM